ncbi:MAG: cardiolipin synthase ClsB [Pseudomonadota bacterium]|jgi:cardiolipin synthase
MSKQPLYSGHQLWLLDGGKAYFPALVEAIDASQSEVRLETYIFAFDASGTLVAQALAHAAQRGVAVYVVMDGIGTPLVPSNWQQRWDQSGVQWRQFSPLGRLGLLIPGRWRRMHRKLCVVDELVAFCGGINILDDYSDPNYGALESPRFDFAVRVTGPLVADVHAAMVKFWARLQATRQLREMHFHQAAQTIAAAVHGSALGTKHTAVRAGLVLRDNLRNRTRIERAYRKAIADAHQEVVIANAYFLPGAKLRHALINAARRGVRVQLLLQGRYEYFMQYHAVRPLYGALLDAGVEIYEYQRGFLHAKVAVVDGNWATVGSSNLDPLSLQLAREANVVAQNESFAHDLHARLLAAIQQHGLRVQPKLYASRPLAQRVLDQLAYAGVRMLLFVMGRRY